MFFSTPFDGDLIRWRCRNGAGLHAGGQHVLNWAQSLMLPTVTTSWMDVGHVMQFSTNVVCWLVAEIWCGMIAFTFAPSDAEAVFAMTGRSPDGSMSWIESFGRHVRWRHDGCHGGALLNAEGGEGDGGWKAPSTSRGDLVDVAAACRAAGHRCRRSAGLRWSLPSTAAATACKVAEIRLFSLLNQVSMTASFPSRSGGLATRQPRGLPSSITTRRRSLRRLLVRHHYIVVSVRRVLVESSMLAAFCRDASCFLKRESSIDGCSTSAGPSPTRNVPAFVQT